MMSSEGYQDRILTCRDCGQEFTFTSGEQEFFASRGLTNAPSRCPACRAARRTGSTNSNSNSNSSSYTPRAPRGNGESFQAVCANCGRQTTVPFQPTEGRAVYCNECFQAVRASRPRRDDSRGGYSSNNSFSGSGSGSSNSGYSTGGYSDSSSSNDSYGAGRGGRDRNDRRDRNNDRSGDRGRRRNSQWEDDNW